MSQETEEKRALSLYLIHKNDANAIKEFIADLTHWEAKVACEEFHYLPALEARLDEILTIRNPRFIPWVYVQGMATATVA